MDDLCNYRFYYPEILKQWDDGQYYDVIRYFADKNRSCLTTFCANLYYHNGGPAKNLIQLAAECAKFENCTVDPQEVKDWVNNLQESWIVAVKSRDDDEVERIAQILNVCPLYKLVTFVSNILFRGEIGEGLFYLGYLAGSFYQKLAREYEYE